MEESPVTDLIDHFQPVVSEAWGISSDQDAASPVCRSAALTTAVLAAGCGGSGAASSGGGSSAAGRSAQSGSAHRSSSPAGSSVASRLQHAARALVEHLHFHAISASCGRVNRGGAVRRPRHGR